MTGNERAADSPIYEHFVADYPYPHVVANLRTYIRILRKQRRELEPSSPKMLKISPINPKILFCPSPQNESAPIFRGKFRISMFWNQYKSAVHDLPNMSDTIKLTYLK